MSKHRGLQAPADENAVLQMDLCGLVDRTELRGHRPCEGVEGGGGVNMRRGGDGWGEGWDGGASVRGDGWVWMGRGRVREVGVGVEVREGLGVGVQRCLYILVIGQ